MICSTRQELELAMRLAEGEAERRHAARRVFLESASLGAEADDHLLAFIENLVVEAEMKRTRACMSFDRHIGNCFLCSPVNSN
jgi:hypothetical protein